MERLRKTLSDLVNQFDDPQMFRKKLESLVSVYPFSEFEYIISYLLAERRLSRKNTKPCAKSISTGICTFRYLKSAPREGLGIPGELVRSCSLRLP